MRILDSINARLHLTEDGEGNPAAKQYYSESGWVGGDIPMPREFQKADGSVKDDLGQLDSVIGPQYDYPKGSFIRRSRMPAPGWADVRPEEVLSSDEIKQERDRAQKDGRALTPYALREAARIKKIMVAIKRHTYSVLRPIAARYPQYSIDDMAGGATLQALMALRRQLDQARDGNKFLSWLTGHLEKGAVQGTGGGAEHRAAIGDINRYLSARRPEQVGELLNKINPENVEHNDNTAKTGPGNPYGKFTPTIAKMGQRLIQAMNAQNPSGESPEAIRQEFEELQNQIKDDEESTLGAKTGFMKGGISIPHSGDDQWQNFVSNVKVGSTHVKGSEGQEIEKPDVETARASAYGEGDRATFDNTDPSWPDLHDASPDTTETFKAALEFSMQQFLASQEEGELGFKLTPGIQKRLQEDLGLSLDVVPSLDLQQIRYICRKLGLRNYPTKGQTYDLEFDRNRYREMVKALVAQGASEQEARVKATNECSSKWVQMGCPTMDSKMDQAAKNRYKQLGHGPEIPSLKDLAPAKVDSETWAGAGMEGPAKDVKKLEDSMKIFGVWYWLYSKYEMNESVSAFDRALVESGWQIYRTAVIRTMLAENDLNQDILTLMLLG